MKTKNKKLYINLERKDNKVYLYIKIPAEIENYFKALSGDDKATSASWLSTNGDGVEFYSLNSSYDNIQTQLNRYYTCFNNFGSGLSSSQTGTNIAPLRIVGASRGVMITSNAFDNDNLIDFEAYIRNLAQITKMLWVDYVGKKKIKAVISFEV